MTVKYNDSYTVNLPLIKNNEFILFTIVKLTCLRLFFMGININV